MRPVLHSKPPQETKLMPIFDILRFYEPRQNLRCAPNLALFGPFADVSFLAVSEIHQLFIYVMDIIKI